MTDILGLRYDRCLVKLDNGWVIQTESSLQVPISDHIAQYIQTLIENIKNETNETNNSNKLLFANTYGKRKGLAPLPTTIKEALNRLAVEKNIVDEEGNLFLFSTSMFQNNRVIELMSEDAADEIYKLVNYSTLIRVLNTLDDTVESKEIWLPKPEPINEDAKYTLGDLNRINLEINLLQREISEKKKLRRAMELYIKNGGYAEIINKNTNLS